MTNHSDEHDEADEHGGIGDDQLPEDLRPTDDNPLAQPLEPGEGADLDLNEPSGSYEQQLEEEGGESGDPEGGSGGSGAPDED